MIHIDYTGGSYGNFLAYIINRYIYQLESANFYPFNKDGAAHVTTADYIDKSLVTAKHYSHNLKYFSDPVNFSKDDVLIRIYVDRPNIYHVFYNGVVRAGGFSLDIDHPEIDTIKKLEALRKDKKDNPHSLLKLNYDHIIKEFGLRKNYPRSGLRNFYYATLREDEFGLDLMNNFINFDVRSTIYVQVQSFLSLNEFIKELTKIALVVNRRFNYDKSFIDMYNNFINKNEGWSSQIKCNKIINDILLGNSVDIKVNILEEAWINCNITQMFDIHEGIECFADNYPVNTKVIHDQIIERLKLTY